MKIGIVGLPGSGKSIVFNLLAGGQGQLKTHPSGKGIQLYLGTIDVPDLRLDHLAKVLRPQKTTHTQITFVDLIGRPGMSIKEFDVTPLRDCDAFAHVVDVFSTSNPVGSMENLEIEFIVMDLDAIGARASKLERDIVKGKKEEKTEYELLLRCKKSLEEEVPLRNIEFTTEEDKLIRGYEFLSIKPMLLVANLGEEQIKGPPTGELKKVAADKRFGFIEFCAPIELEVSQLEEAERGAFLEELGIQQPARDKFIHASYEMLGLVSFFTVVGEEVKAWTIGSQTRAVEAAGKIHSDMQRGFIRAEVISYEDFVSCESSFQNAKSKGLLRLEGKDYIVKDGDIINFRFSV